MNPNLSVLLFLKGGEKQEMRDEKRPTAQQHMIARLLGVICALIVCHFHSFMEHFLPLVCAPCDCLCNMFW
jgi:hypothetical protein